MRLHLALATFATFAAFATLMLAMPMRTVLAQELTLFERIDADTAPESSAQIAPIGMGVPQSGQPAFTLRGTSRFGDEFTTTLLDRNGQPVKIKWRAGENVPVPGFDGFSLVGVDSRSVSLVHPPFDACVTSEQAAVSCRDSNTSVLSITTAMPLAINGTPPDMSQFQNQPPFMVNGAPVPARLDPTTVIHDAQAQQVVINPFNGQAEILNQTPEEMAARAERQQRRAERFNQIEAVRISPEDVPPGMRLVRTPFGDRLVPARE